MAAQQPDNLRPGDPYCGKCGYALLNLVDACRCPECGTPFVEGLVRGRADFGGKGRRYVSEAKIFNMPVFCIATGPHGDEPFGKARGFIAVGDTARGVLAIGGRATGVVAIGGSTLGIFTMGGVNTGLVSAMGGLCIGGLAVGGGSVGVVANGGMSVGVIAEGGIAVGVYARGGGVVALHRANGRNPDPDAVRVFQALSPILGNSGGLPFTAGSVVGGVTAVIALLIGVAAVAAIRRHDRRTTTGAGL